MEYQSPRREGCYWKRFQFFKVLIGDFHSCLEIPPAFRTHIAIKRSGTATVKNQCGRRWKIELIRTGKRMMLTKGWEIFVEENELRIGYFLVFQYDGGLHFTVTVFDTTACEKTFCDVDSLNCEHTSRRVGDRKHGRKKDRSSSNVVNRKRNKVSSKARASVGSFKSPNLSFRGVSSHPRNCKLAAVVAKLQPSDFLLQNTAELGSGSVDEEAEAVDANEMALGTWVAKLKLAFVKLKRGQKVIDHSDENITLAAWLALDATWRGGSIMQRPKVIDISDEDITLAAWLALCNSCKGCSNLVQKFETSNSTLVDSVQRDNLPVYDASLVSSQVVTGKGFTAKGIQVPDFVGRETTDLLMDETGVEFEKDLKESELKDKEEQFCQEVPFDRCFHIYGGQQKLEALEALSSHHALQYNRKKKKLPCEKRLVCDGNLDQVMQIFTLSMENEFSSMDADKGKELDITGVADGYVTKTLCDSSVSKVAKMVAEFATAVKEVVADEIIELTSGIFEAIHSEGVRSLSKLCCFGLSQLLIFVQSISSGSKSENGKHEDSDKHEDGAFVKIGWPGDPLLKARIIRSKAQSMIAEVTTVSSSFITGILDVVEACQTAIKSSATDSANIFQEKSIQEKAHAISDHLRSNAAAAIDKILDGLECLPFVILSTSVAASNDAR